MFGIRGAFVVRNDESLNLEGLVEELSGYGEITEIEDNEIEEFCPVKVIYIDCSMNKWFRLKLDYNCITLADNDYILFPMENYEEKQKALNNRELRAR